MSRGWPVPARARPAWQQSRCGSKQIWQFQPWQHVQVVIIAIRPPRCRACWPAGLTLAAAGHAAVLAASAVRPCCAAPVFAVICQAHETATVRVDAAMTTACGCAAAHLLAVELQGRCRQLADAAHCSCHISPGRLPVGDNAGQITEQLPAHSEWAKSRQLTRWNIHCQMSSAAGSAPSGEQCSTRDLWMAARSTPSCLSSLQSSCATCRTTIGDKL